MFLPYKTLSMHVSSGRGLNLPFNKRPNPNFRRAVNTLKKRKRIVKNYFVEFISSSAEYRAVAEGENIKLSLRTRTRK